MLAVPFKRSIYEGSGGEFRAVRGAAKVAAGTEKRFGISGHTPGCAIVVGQEGADLRHYSAKRPGRPTDRRQIRRAPRSLDFGSVARGEADAQSDVDFLVELDPSDRCWTLAGCSLSLRRCSAARWTW